MEKLIFQGVHSTYDSADGGASRPVTDKFNIREDASWGYIGVPGVLAEEIDGQWWNLFNRQTEDFIYEHGKGNLTRNDAILKQYGFPTNDVVKQLLYAESHQKIDRALTKAKTPKSILRRISHFEHGDTRKPLFLRTDEELINRAFLTVCSFSKYGNDVKEYFKSKKGGIKKHGKVEFMSSISTGKTPLLNVIKKKVSEQYKRNGAIITPINISKELAENMLNFRKAILDKSLMVVFGGVQHVEIKGYLIKKEKVRLSKYEKLKDVTQLTIDIDVTIKDWYGVDEEDVYKNAFAANLDREGLACLWILQHQRGYKPFINQIEHEIKGVIIHVDHR